MTLCARRSKPSRGFALPTPIKRSRAPTVPSPSIPSILPLLVHNLSLPDSFGKIPIRCGFYKPSEQPLECVASRFCIRLKRLAPPSTSARSEPRSHVSNNAASSNKEKDAGTRCGRPVTEDDWPKLRAYGGTGRRDGFGYRWAFFGAEPGEKTRMGSRPFTPTNMMIA